MARVRKLKGRERVKRRIRKRLLGNDSVPRICVYRSTKHIYAQLISDESGKTLASAWSGDEEFAAALGQVKAEDAGTSRTTKSVAAGYAVGNLLGKRAQEKGFKKVIFDRNGYLYHGRVSAVAEGARKAGLDF